MIHLSVLILFIIIVAAIVIGGILLSIWASFWWTVLFLLGVGSVLISILAIGLCSAHDDDNYIY